MTDDKIVNDVLKAWNREKPLGNIIILDKNVAIPLIQLTIRKTLQEYEKDIEIFKKDNIRCVGFIGLAKRINNKLQTDKHFYESDLAEMIQEYFNDMRKKTRE